MVSHYVVTEENRRFDSALNWVVRVVGVVAIALVIGIMVVSGDPIVHGHPAHWVLLIVVLVIAVVAIVRTFVPRKKNSSVRRVGRSLLVVLALGGLALVGWLTPAGVTTTGIDAVQPSSGVAVIEDAVQIGLVPTGAVRPTGVLFQPGAKVDARAYASTLRPLAEAGHVVVIAKQPLGIGFLAMTALDSARAAFPDVAQWVVGGHSLGGTAAAAQISSTQANPNVAPVVGLFLYGSYPATDMSTLSIPVLSVSGEKDMLSTRESIQASRANLPQGTQFIEIAGATHAYFGDYGLQAGDGTATVSREQAHAQISGATIEWISALER